MEYLSLIDITKIYPNGVVANDRVNFELRRGEIHAIAGENGAGKSTVMKILYGLEKPDGGEIRLEGKTLEISSPQDAIRHAIGMVPQHSMLIREMTVTENIFLGIETRRAGLLDRRYMLNETRRLCETYQMQVEAEAPCGSLTVSSAQKVSILKALARGARILILDEPTAVLAPQETAELFDQLRLLKKASYSIIIITHKLKEIKQLCDRVTILRAGRDRGTFRVEEVSEEQISRLMVGGESGDFHGKTPAPPGAPVLKVSSLTVTRENRSRSVEQVSFSVRQGEIVCLAGVEGNGQQEAIRCVTGLERGYSGEIYLNGHDLSKLTIKRIRRTGMAHVPEDRLGTGSNPSASILDNLIANTYDRVSHWGFINYRRLKEEAGKLVARYGIQMRDLQQPFHSLSGGNMQKLIIAREFSQEAALVVVDQPTRGVDVGATAYIHQELLNLRDAGSAILLVSADINEVLTLADRILVFHAGRITAQITDIQSLSEEQLGRYMLGIDVMSDLVCL